MNILNLIKNLFYICIGLCFLTAFSSNIEVFLGENEYFSWLWNISSLWLLDFFVILTVLFYTSLKINDCEIETPNRSCSLFILLAIILYSYERFFSNYFVFTPFKFTSLTSNPHIFYLDILYWLGLLHFSGYLKYLNPQNKSKIQKNKVIEDAPIHTNKEDGLDGLLNIPARKIYKIIKENKFKSSFTIGLNGEWGDGKTSVFNLIKDNLKDHENCVIVDFNPWMGFDKKVLVKDFFNSLSEHLGSSFSHELSDYTNEILNNGEDNNWVKILQSFFNKNDESLNSIFEKINEKIGRLQKKIIVFIDDVDRLDKEEIFEILKLIRKTANFQNTFFVIAYDRNYVNNSIKDQSGITVIKYLDKIINVEISLPYFDKYALKTYFVENLKTVIPQQYHYKINHFVKTYEKDPLVIDLGFEEHDLFLYWLNNFREIKKIINAIVINYSELYGQVNFVDVIYLEILKLKHPHLYFILFTKQTELFAINHNAFCYDLAPIDNVKAIDKYIKYMLEKKKNFGIENSSVSEKSLTVFDYYLDQYVADNSINNIEKEKIIDLINRLFYRLDDSSSMYSRVGVDLEDALSVKFVTKFERYFSHTIFKGNISEDEFEEFLSLENSEIERRIKSWLSEGKINDLSYRLNQKFTFNNKKQYNNTLIASFIISPINEGKINFQQLISKMFGQTLYPNIFSSKDDACNFFIHLFSSDFNTPLSKAKLLNELSRRNKKRGNGDDPEKFPLSDFEINKLLHNYIFNELQDFKMFNENFWSLYFACQEITANFSKKPFQDINELIIKKINNKLETLQFLKSLVYYNNYGYESKINKDAILDVFNSLENFENNFLKTLDNNEYVIKFKEYFEKSKINNWGFIDFEYDFLKESIQRD